MVKQKTTTKDALLNTAINLFRENGFENVTVEDICKEIDVTKTAFYYYYKSKDELIRDFFCGEHMLSHSELAAILYEQDCAKQILRIMEMRIQQVTRAGLQLAKELYRVYLKDEALPLAEQNELSDILITLIKRGQEAGQIKNTAAPELLQNTIWYLSNGIILKWIMMGGSFDVLEENRIQFAAVFY